MMLNSPRSYWDTIPRCSYHRMLQRHRPLWQFVYDFIREREIRSVLEVGCGLLNPVKRWVEDYQAIDLNEQTKAIHADFRTMDVQPWHGVDLLLACGVIEHCEDGYERFLLQVKVVQARYALVSLFNSLARKANVRYRHEGDYCLRGYAGDKLKTWLDANGFNWRIEVLGRNDTVLVLEGER